jgi:EmrB/QacA subfamily drug resistance transporter
LANTKSRMGFTLAGLMLGIFVTAIDNTIVATAIGTIVGELGGLDKIVWVTSAYLVTEMAGMPIFGKLSDMYGRKKFFVVGMILFLLGSILCGTAHNIVELSLYRAIQGIGGGALFPVAFTILFDIVPMEKRGSMSGIFGAVFGTSSLVGPLLGAYLTDYIHWRWIFYINVPLGLLALGLVWLFYRESVERSEQQIDWWGAAALVIAVVTLMFAMELGGQQYSWGSPIIIGLFGAAALLFAVFLYIETKADEPIISYSMFRRRLFAASTVAGLFYGPGFIMFAIYIPIFIQGVHGGSATQSGLVLLPMTLASVLAAQLGGVAATRVSYRNVMIASALIFTTGTYLLSMLTPETPRWALVVNMIVVGAGIGISFSVLSMATMHGFDMRQRGSASSTMWFVRSLGMTVGLTIFGILQRNALTAKLSDAFGGAGGAPVGESLGDIRKSLSPETRANIPKPVLDKIIDALTSSITTMFLWAVIPAVLALVCVTFMGSERMELPVKAVRRQRGG